jgi:integrase
MDEQTVKELYQFNVNFISDDFGPMSKKRKAESPQSWAGSTVRLMLQLMFITAMLLLLRFDEVLRITWSDIHFEHYQPRRRRIRLMLPFRKTHQYGGKPTTGNEVPLLTCSIAGIVPFYLYENPDKPWMCPVRAWAAWWYHSRQLGLNMNGYVFRKKMGRNSVSASPHDAMVSHSCPKWALC